MKILAPVSSRDELEMLIENGAEELYCGVVPTEWLSRYTGAVWLNRRSPKGGSLETVDGLRPLVEDAHKHSVPVFVTLNAPYYTEEQLSWVMDLARRLDGETGVDAFIVADVNLLMQLSRAGLNTATHISSVAATLNTEAIRFLLEFGPSRVILPRSVTLFEMEKIANAVRREVELEAFMLNDGCAFEEGFCATTHHHSVGAFCTNLSDMQTEFEASGGRSLSLRQNRRFGRNLRDYREWVWYINGNGCGTTPSGLPYGPCGLCAVHDLYRMGIASLKIVGREATPFKKLASVKMVRDIVDRVRAGASKLVTIERARSLRRTPEHCDAGYMCYYKVENGGSNER